MGVSSPAPLTATKPLLLRNPIRGSGNSNSRSSLLSAHLGGRASGPPLCGGEPPATPSNTPCHFGAAALVLCLCHQSRTHVVPRSLPLPHTTVGAGLVPALYLPQCMQTVSATAGIKPTPDCLHPKSGTPPQDPKWCIPTRERKICRPRNGKYIRGHRRRDSNRLPSSCTCLYSRNADRKP